MSRQYDTVTIRPAQNGFILERSESAAHVGTTFTSPWVFESFDSMVKWLKENYVEGDQPNKES